jgi:hypothetical protein
MVPEGDCRVPYKSRLAGGLYNQGYKEGYRPLAAGTVSTGARLRKP